jgi:putative addiction module component (TIGR02574 family)
LSVDEKIDYLESLWDRIAATPETIPVPDWHRDILDERLKDLEADPGAGDSWDTVQERLRKKFDTSRWLNGDGVWQWLTSNPPGHSW